MQDVLIPTRGNAMHDDARRHLRSLFTDVPEHEIRMLANYGLASFQAGSIIVRNDEEPESVFLLVHGVAEFIESGTTVTNRMSAGAIFGEMHALESAGSTGTFRAVSYLTALQIPVNHFVEFVERNGLRPILTDLHEKRRFLRRSWYFSEAVSYPVQTRLARSIKEVTVGKGELPEKVTKGCLVMLRGGLIQLAAGEQIVDVLQSGDMCGEERVLLGGRSVFHAVVTDEAKLFLLPCDVVSDIPVLRWKLLETLDRRLRSLTSTISLEWQEDFTVFDDEIDEQHRGLFSTAKAMYEHWRVHGVDRRFMKELDRIMSSAEAHFATEEQLLEEISFPHLEAHRERHQELRTMLAKFRSEAEERRTWQGASAEDAEFGDRLLELVRNWLVRHLLLEDGRYRSQLPAAPLTPDPD
jgi:hemerythrin